MFYNIWLFTNTQVQLQCPTSRILTVTTFIVLKYLTDTPCMIMKARHACTNNITIPTTIVPYGATAWDSRYSYVRLAEGSASKLWQQSCYMHTAGHGLCKWDIKHIQAASSPVTGMNVGINAVRNGVLFILLQMGTNTYKYHIALLQSLWRM